MTRQRGRADCRRRTPLGKAWWRRREAQRGVFIFEYFNGGIGDGQVVQP